MQRLIRHGERRTFDTGVLREGGNCRSVLYALGVLLVCLLGSYLFLFRLEHVRVLQEREKARYVVDSYATKIQYVVANAFSSAYLVEALLRQGEGRISEFYSYAEELVKMHPSTININLAPRGVVTKVYPFERNKKAIGHDLFANPERSREALLARDSGKATIAGPFDLIQGGYAMAVRLPVFMGEPEGDITAQEKFWGLICVTFAFPDVLDPVKLEYLDKQLRVPAFPHPPRHGGPDRAVAFRRNADRARGKEGAPAQCGLDPERDAQGRVELEHPVRFFRHRHLYQHPVLMRGGFGRGSCPSKEAAGVDVGARSPDGASQPPCLVP